MLFNDRDIRRRGRKPRLLGRGQRTTRQLRRYNDRWLCDRTLVAVITFTFTRVGAVVSLRVEDY